ncbi:mitochondrial ribosomal protein L37-domain-containing protein [Podospora conica]|nr:mitochondrial ribosomal protein L37-domain-containing protein [Schizothecium conicum]
MPTPESAAFLAKKPTVPPTFDGVDYEDTTRLKQAQDAIVREQWVKVMMGRLVREELGKCYYREGVNHLEKCGHLRGQRTVSRAICLSSRTTSPRTPPNNLTPLTPSPTDAESADAPPALSSCLPGTKLNGLNYIKGREDPVALADDAYPAWLWDCLTVMKKAEDANAGADDEFSKSKKTRRLAKKRRLAAEATLLATGDLQALVPKIPLGKQSINLPGGEGEGLEGAVQAAEAREDLRRALRKERKKGIKESNYLKTM